jgi:glycerol-3-phosphate dehydrogenase
VSAAALSRMGAVVALVDRGDFAGGTSQESSTLVWGGIKYLENLEFGLVRSLCRSRNTLLAELPDHVREVRFLAPHALGFRRNAVVLRVGTWLYWVIGGRKTRGPFWHDSKQLSDLDLGVRRGLFDGALEYSDGLLTESDARFTYHFIRQAREAGALCLNYAEAGAFHRGKDGLWDASVRVDGLAEPVAVKARVLVNAAGPWADDMGNQMGLHTQHRHLLSKGIHLVVRPIGDPKRVLAFFGDDGRLFFIIPWGDRSLVGTTDTPVKAMGENRVTEDDRRFVLDNINHRLKLTEPLTTDDIIAERCGVRPLAIKRSEGGDGSSPTGGDFLKLSRHHVVELHPKEKALTCFGGKLTDCLNLGEEVARNVRHLGVLTTKPQAIWWRDANLADRVTFFEQAERRLVVSAGTTEGRLSLASRLWQRYGPAARRLFSVLEREAGEGFEIFPGAEYLWAEAVLARDAEAIHTLSDLLRRRTRIALRFRHSDLARNRSLWEVCRRIFPEDPRGAWKAYFGQDPFDDGAVESGRGHL